MVSQWGLKLDRPPVVRAGGPYAVDEGSSIALSASADDPDGDAVTYAWDLDGDGTFETTGQSVVISPADGPGARTVTARATDSFGLSSTDAATVTVHNVPPNATFHAPSSATVGVPFTISLTGPHDPSATDATAGFLYAFDCGDRSGYGTFGSAPSTSCRTLALGTRTVRGAIRDKDGGITEYTTSVSVGVTFDAVCAIAEQLASTPKAAEKVCNALAKAEREAAESHRRQEVEALVKAAAAVVKEAARGSFTPAEAATLLRLIAKL
jgi:hypothetical protein